jgi:Flp pilus assembly protein TadG
MGGVTDVGNGRSRGVGERGAALVEMAFIMPLLLMLLLGTVTAGIAYHQFNSLQTAAREGSRFAATLPDVESNLGVVLDVTKSAAVGYLTGSAPGQDLCVAAISSAGTSSMTEVGGARSPGTSECFSDGRPSDEHRVQVVVERGATINALLFTDDVTLSSESVARYER